jgi:hypothetical protein
MTKYIALYCMPHTSLADWGKKPQEERAGEENRLKELWIAWTQAQGAALLLTASAGKATQVTSSGATERSNDVMMYTLVEAESKDAAVAMFANHPHLQIPGAWIDVMEARKMEM